LNDVGLEYLTLDRLASTLSGGEAQRIQLATSLGSRLVGACYVLDEPSIGLHTRDTDRLIRILQHLRDLGNTIVVVEHDREVMAASDYIVDMGPGPGERGGQVMFQGPFADISANGHHSLTGLYLSGHFSIPVPSERRKISRRQLRMSGAVAHNLKNIDVTIPLGVMTVVSGVSGSGKSTLVHDVIFKALEVVKKRRLGDNADADPEALRLPCRRISGERQISETVLVDQSPIGRSPRSNPVTYVKAFDVIRDLFSSTPDAKRRGFTPGNFSFNIPGGRCETCQGDGTVTVEMQFLADVELICDDCQGKRYKNEILEVRYQGKNIHEVLGMTIDEALRFFVRTPKVVDKLSPLAEVGLGYLRLGQSATTLSGGEAQRVKLAGHIAQSTCENTLYIFDEPTTGLHFDDIAKLLAAFRKLLANGATVLAIEHNLDVIKNADWIIDLGPEGGEGGGSVVVQGTPEEVAACAGSYTGRYLAKLL
jgi:excinuclease ABC subunit A